MTTQVNLYESDAMATVTGATIRPGGLELTEKAVTLCNLFPGAGILDIGCGTGATVRYLNDRHNLNAMGIDLSQLLLKKGRQTDSRLPVARADAAYLPFSDRCFEAVFCECVLSLTLDPVAVLRECRRVLKPGGRVIITDLYLRSSGNVVSADFLSVASCLKGAVTRDELKARLVVAGFTLRSWEDHSHLLKLLAARMVFAYGSMEQFWSLFYDDIDTAGMQWIICRARPGYCLLTAEKEE
jgi:arsenite methyltransferase